MLHQLQDHNQLTKFKVKASKDWLLFLVIFEDFTLGSWTTFEGLETHPGQSEVHLHLRHPLPHTGPHADTEWDEAVRVVSVVAAAGRHVAEPPIRDEALRVDKLHLIVTGCVVTQVELSLKRKTRL